MARILVVDDEEDLEILINQKFRKKIKNNEYQFFFAENGVEALSLINSVENIDMVLSDINMPCLLYTSPSPRDKRQSRMPSSA